jgi:hypothetical protein
VVSSSFPIITLLSLLSATKQLEPFGKHVLDLLKRQTIVSGTNRKIAIRPMREKAA